MTTNPTNPDNAACRGTCRAQSITGSRGAWVYGSLKELKTLESTVATLTAEIEALTAETKALKAQVDNLPTGASNLYQLDDCSNALATAVQGSTIVRDSTATEWVSMGGSRIALGNGTNVTLNGSITTAIGFSNTGNAHNLGTSSTGAIAIGVQSGADSTGTSNNSGAIAIGVQAGEIGQYSRAIAMGYLAGKSDQGTGAVAIGGGAGAISQASLAVALGTGAGQSNQGTHALALGNNAGVTSQASESIVINGTGSPLNNTVSNTYVIKPVRGDTAQVGALTNFIPPAGFNLVGYNPTTGEMIYYTST